MEDNQDRGEPGGPGSTRAGGKPTGGQPRSFLTALRHYWALVVIVAALVAAGVTASAGNEAREEGIEYRARALVIAQTLELRPELLPKTAAEIFETAAVANRATDLAEIPYEPSEILPDHAEMEPVDNSVVVRVEGIDADPEVAAELANGMARALVAELNRAGPGVGVFAIQDLARPPEGPVPRQEIPIRVAVGMVSGIVLAFGLLGLVVAVRRPLLAEEQVVDAVGSPALGEISVPAGTRSIDDPTRFLGLGAHIDELEDRLVDASPDNPTKALRVAYVSTQADHLMRSQFVAFLAAELSNSRSTHYVSVDGTRTPWNTDLVGTPQLEVTFRTPVLYRTDPETSLILDGPPSDLVDLRQVLPREVPVVIVIQVGRARPVLERLLLSQLGPFDVVGFVLIRKMPWWRMGPNGLRRQLTARRRRPAKAPGPVLADAKPSRAGRQSPSPLEEDPASQQSRSTAGS